MNFTPLKDQDLHSKLVATVREEKKLLHQILHLLQEVERRKLYCDHHCKSLFDYAVKILKYSEAEAYTRIAAMRLIKQIPEVEKDLQSGTLTLTNVAQAQSFFRKQESPLPLEKKKSVMASLRNQPTRKAKEILSELAPQSDAATDRIRTLADGRIEIRFALNEDNYQRLRELRDLMSKPGEDLSLEQLFVRLHERVQESPRAPRKQGVAVANRSLTPATKIAVKNRDGHRCKNCGSAKNLEIHHIQPKALGGGHHPDNLQTLCRPCNQRRAIKTFGLGQILRAQGKMK